MLTNGGCTYGRTYHAVSITGYDIQPVPKEKEVRLNPEEVLHVIRYRRTVRQFQEKKVPKEALVRILEAGGMTHTAKNMRDISFIVLDKKKAEYERMAVNLFRKVKPLADLFSPMARRNRIGDHFFFFHAPVVIVITAKSAIDGSLAAQNMEFAAEAEGLGVLFSGYFTAAANHSRKLRKALGIPKGKKAVTTLVLGYPKVKYLRSVPRNKISVTYR